MGYTIIQPHALQFLVMGMKDNVYQKQLTTVFNLKNSIRRNILYSQNIHADSLLSMVESAIFRMGCVVEHDGLHIDHVLKL